MRLNLKGMIFAGMLFFGVASFGAQEKPTVSVMPDKILYAPGETAKFDVTVANGTKAGVKGELQVKVLWEMEDSEKIKEEAVSWRLARREPSPPTGKLPTCWDARSRGAERRSETLSPRPRSISTSARPKTRSGWASTPGIRGSLLGPGRIISTRFHRWWRICVGPT